MTKQPTARQLMDHAAATHNAALLASLIAASALEFMYFEQTHQPAPLADRVDDVVRAVASAFTPPPSRAPIRIPR